MDYNCEEYMPRPLNDIVANYLRMLDTVFVKGSKRCGKNWNAYKLPKPKLQ